MTRWAIRREWCRHRWLWTVRDPLGRPWSTHTTWAWALRSLHLVPAEQHTAIAAVLTRRETA